MKVKVLAILGLAAVVGVGACRSATNTATNTTTNPTNTATVATPTAVPKTNESATVDPNMKSKVEAALKAKGYTDVTVDTTDGKMTLRGTVGKNKTAELMAAAMEANGGKPVVNQVTEK